MAILFNTKQLKAKRRSLRNNMTLTEVTLWSHLKHSQLGGLKFRRQASIGKYIVDFYCPKKKLAIELDGDVHGYSSRIISDKNREEEIKSLGIKMLRFANREVRENLDGVLGEILSVAGVAENRTTP